MTAALENQTQALTIALACGLGGLLYAFIVSAGRAGLGPEDASWVRIAEMARARFHYWWLAFNLEHVGDNIKSISKVITGSKFNRKNSQAIAKIFLDVQKVYSNSI